MKKSLPFRSWYYFRTGYSQYFVFILAVLNMLTLTYYLAIENSSIEKMFPSFTSYILVSSAIGIPLLILLGFLHMKKTAAFRSEIEITNESNPYNYKLMPGIHKEVIAPLLLELLVMARKNDSNELTDDEFKKIEELDKKLNLLEKGGILTIPKKFDEL